MRYISSLEGISSEMLTGFFVGWNSHPSTDKHLEMLHNSYKVVLAIDDNSNQVVGFISAISDGVLSAYIPLLEVLPAYQNKGIGQELVSCMLDELQDIYMIDLICDEELQAYYERLGMLRSTGMVVRNYKFQVGR